MIQDIPNGLFSNAYTPRPSTPEDIVCVFTAHRVLASTAGDRIHLPRRREVELPEAQLQYLFSLGDTAWYLARQSAEAAGYEPVSVRVFRTLGPRETAFGLITAWHLAQWYRSNRFCGTCGRELVHKADERALVCPGCGGTVYPRINPAVIVAVCRGDQLLLTKYAGRDYTNYALIAGFCEIGETPEDTVHREVFEEAGLQVTDLRYYKSQPWALTSTLLLGFFVRLDGSSQVHIDAQELATARWVDRAVVAGMPDDGVSLTREMMALFGAGRDPFSLED